MILILKGGRMADRSIYRLREYNSMTGEELIVYGVHKHELETMLPTVSEDQEITTINFDANDMETLVNELNKKEEVA